MIDVLRSKKQINFFTDLRQQILNVNIDGNASFLDRQKTCC